MWRCRRHRLCRGEALRVALEPFETEKLFPYRCGVVPGRRASTISADISKDRVHQRLSLRRRAAAAAECTARPPPCDDSANLLLNRSLSTQKEDLAGAISALHILQREADGRETRSQNPLLRRSPAQVTCRWWWARKWRLNGSLKVTAGSVAELSCSGPLALLRLSDRNRCAPGHRSRSRRGLHFLLRLSDFAVAALLSLGHHVLLGQAGAAVAAGENKRPRHLDEARPNRQNHVFRQQKKTWREYYLRRTKSYVRARLAGTFYMGANRSEDKEKSNYSCYL